MWEEELALHTPNPAAAEASVYRQRVLSWATRGSAEKLQMVHAVSRGTGAGTVPPAR